MTENSLATTSRFNAASPLSRALCWATILSLVLCGCGSGEARGRVVGKVTFQGQAVPEGIVVFNNDEKAVHTNAKLKSDGNYEIITAKGAGLPIGTYRIAVRPPSPRPAPLPTSVAAAKSEPEETKQYPNIPQKYRDPKTSGLTLTVKEGENSFDIAMQP